MEVTSIQQTPAVASTQVKVQPQVVSERRDLARAARVVNSSGTLGTSNELVLLVDRATHRAIMRLVDRVTKEVVMQIPNEQVLQLARDVQKGGGTAETF